MESLIQELKKLNLSDKEARVYLALLELGPSSPYKIAKHSRLKRPTAYVIAEELVEKGLIVQMTGEKQGMYIAKSPETYVEEVERRVKDARKIVPELLALQRKKSEKPNVLYFEGLEGMKKAYEYRLKDLKGKEIVGFFAKSNKDERLNNDVFIPWNEVIKKQGTTMRGFTVDDPGLRDFGRFFHKISGGHSYLKFLPEAVYSSDCSIESFEFGVRIMMMNTKQVIIIESAEFALALKQVMELLWQKTKGEYDQPKKLDFKGLLQDVTSP